MQTSVRHPGLLGWLLLAVLTLAPPQWAVSAEPEKPRFQRPVRIVFEGVITPLSGQSFLRRLEEARQQRADLVIVQIDSPGGELETSLAMASALNETVWAHTVAYIPREALSGAAMTALGCDEIVMGPRAVLGDVGVVNIFRRFMGVDIQHAEEKFRTDTALRMRELARANGRPPALAEAMVDMNLVVFEVENLDDGSRTFMSEHEIESDGGDARWKKLAPVLESRAGQFLEVTGERAVVLQLADANASSLEELLDRYELARTPRVLQHTWVDTTVAVLNNPWITGLLFVVGLIALYVEASSPGIGFGAMLSGLCFLLFFWSRVLGGTAGWLEVLLFLAGITFLAVELFIFPGFGVTGVTGFLLLFASLLLASQNFIVPSDSVQMSKLMQTLLTLVGSAAAFTVAAIVYSWIFGQVPVLSQFRLEPPVDDELPAEVAVAGSGGGVHRSGVKVGDHGVAVSYLRPAGRARFGDVSIDVVADGTFVVADTPLVVVEVRGNRVLVREAT